MRCSEKYWVGGRAYGDLEGADVMVECSYIFKNMISTIYEQYLRCCSNAGCTQFAVGKVLLNSLFGVLFVGRCHSHLPKTLFLVIPRQDLHLETLGYDERSWNSMKLGPGHCTDGDWGA